MCTCWIILNLNFFSDPSIYVYIYVNCPFIYFRRNLLIPHASITRSQSSVYEREREAQQDPRRNRSGSQGHLSFEEVCRQRTSDSTVSNPS